MISPQTKPRLPEIVITQSFEKSNAIHTKSDRSGWTSSLYKMKPTFIAKKISSEELFGDSCRATSAVLSQINEEKVHDVDEPDDPDDPSVLVSAEGDVDINESKGEEHRNIFKKESLISSKYKEQGKGPIYGRTGHIVKHSIVGSSEMFERHQRNLKKGHLKESNTLLDKENASFSDRSGSKVLKPLISFHGNDQTQMSTSGIFTHNSFAQKKFIPAATEKKKEVQKTVRVTKEDLLMKIEQMRTTQDKFYITESQKYKTEPLSDQIFHSKEQRCLEKFDKSLNQWNMTLNSTNRKIKRNAGISVMTSSDGFRDKIEEAEVFTMAQSDHERFGSTFWYMTLRDYGGGSVRNTQRVIHDIPSGFNSPQVNRPTTSIEIVKKQSKLSSSSSLLPTLTGSASALTLDRTRREYVNEKSALLKSELKKIKPLDPVMFTDFMVEGRNKLEMEVTAFFRVNPGREVYNVPREIFEDRNVQQEPEYFARNYEGREIIKNGIGAYIK